MQRIGINGRRIIFRIVLPIVFLLVLISLDQFTKYFFKDLYQKKGNTLFLGEFLSFTYTFNQGAAYGLFAGKEWGQVFFKILTVVALVIFALLFIYSYKKRNLFLSYSVFTVMAGTIGNFIDRLLNNGVIDFITIKVGDFIPFGIFNLADVFLSLGVILMIIHFLFIDENAVFRKSVNGNDKSKS